MSQTKNVGVFDIEHYIQMAAVMEESLTVVFSEKEVKINSFPIAVLKSAQKFFSSIVESFKEKVPANPLASSHDYNIAIEIIAEMKRNPNITREECIKVLEEYKNFVDSLCTPRHLLNHEIKIARNLLDFFKTLYAEYKY
jgi:hypothetical protein